MINNISKSITGKLVRNKSKNIFNMLMAQSYLKSAGCASGHKGLSLPEGSDPIQSKAAIFQTICEKQFKSACKDEFLNQFVKANPS